MTPDQVLTTVRDQLYEPVPSFWSNSELYNYMWQAEQEIALQIKCTQTQTFTTTTTAVSMYTRPVDCYYIERLTWDKVKLKKIDLTDHDALQRVAYGGMYTIGRAMHYYEYGDQIGLWPIPSYSAPICFWYQATPAQVTTASSQFTVPSLFHNMISDYVCYKAVLKDQDDSKAKFYKTQWDQGIVKAYQMWNNKVNSDFYHVVKEEDSYRNVELGMI